MNIRSILLNTAMFSGISVLMVMAVYLVDVWLLSSNANLSPTEALFIEGIIFVIIGLLLLLGRGGISRTSRSAAILTASAGAVSGRDTIGPNEIFRRDAWKAEGFTRTALILTLSGVFMILLYFLTL
jgi:hypothetical protein